MTSPAPQLPAGFTLPEGEFDAIVFDCDGTLGDTMPAHYEAWLATIEPLGLSMSEDHFYAMGGWPTSKVFAHLFEAAGRTGEIDRLVTEKEDRFREFLHAVEPIVPVIEIARRYHGRMPLAVASGGLRPVVHEILQAIGFELSFFDAIVTCEDVRRHKPEPDIFLEAARRLGVDPTRCLAFEDTEPGLASARAAGMHVRDVREVHRPRRITT